MVRGRGKRENEIRLTVINNNNDETCVSTSADSYFIKSGASHSAEVTCNPLTWERQLPAGENLSLCRSERAGTRRAET